MLIVVPLLDDFNVELEESFTVRLSGVGSDEAGVAITQSETTVSILDNDRKFQCTRIMLNSNCDTHYLFEVKT